MNQVEKMDCILSWMVKNSQEIPLSPDIILRNSKCQIDRHEAFLIINRIHKDGYLTKIETGNAFQIKQDGILFLNSGGYTAKKLQDEISIEKLMFDFKNAERTYKSYPATRFMAIAAFIISLLLLFLKLAEVLGIWPYPIGKM
jgi:hypothetical protein